MNSGHTYRERIGAPEAGRSVLEHLVARHSHSDASVWRRRIASGEIDLGDAPAAADDLLRPGQTLVWRRAPWEEEEVPLAFALLHRDSHLLAFAKPSGLPTMPGGGFLEHTLLRLVERRFPGAAPAHRLGRGTSGLVLFTRSPEARRSVLRQWGSGAVRKTYLALVSGRPQEDTFSVQVPIGPVPHPRLGEVFAASPEGRPALSHARVAFERPGAAVVEVEIPTGRPHQIRIHMAAAGHPLVGDPLYCAGGHLREDPALPGATGYLLHAWRLELHHPATGDPLVLWCSPPSGLRRES